jgi:hypothetical protein
MTQTTASIANPAGVPTTAQNGTAAGVIGAIRAASARDGMSFDVMLATAKLESGLNPTAEAGTSSAAGLFQFIDQTWLDAVRQYGPAHGLGAEAAQITNSDGRMTVTDPAARQRILDLRKDPEVASAIAGDHLRAISDRLGAVLGQAPDATQIYLGHLLGGGGAAQMLAAERSNPVAPAGDLLPAAARANPALFNAPDGTPYSVTQFMNHLNDRVGRAFASVGAVMPQGPVNLTQTQVATIDGNQKRPRLASRFARQPVERVVVANLSTVFNRLDSAVRSSKSAVRRHGAAPDQLPAGLMGGLAGPAGAIG